MSRLAFLAMVVAAPAFAQERPLTTPTRDVDVTYRSTAEGQAVEQRSRFAVTQKKIRVDTPSPGLYIIVDRAAQTMNMVSDADLGVLQLPYDQATVSGVPANQKFVRQGSDVVAGVPCTDWQSTDAAGQSVVVCITTDGVLLRVKSGSDVLVQAVKVAYGPVDPSAFAVPPGYQRRSAGDSKSRDSR